MANERKILLNLIAGSYLADHLGDIQEDMLKAAKQAGFKTLDDMPEEITMGGDPWRDYCRQLAREYGATTIWGTSLLDDE